MLLLLPLLPFHFLHDDNYSYCRQCEGEVVGVRGRGVGVRGRGVGVRGKGVGVRGRVSVWGRRCQCEG